MTELIKVQEEIIKLGHDPQYIDYFKKMVKNNWHIQSYKELLDEAITYYKDKEEQSIYNICILLRQKNEMIYGHLNQAIEMGENWLENLEIEKDLSISIEGYNQQFSAYMYKGEFKKAITYSLKAFDLLERGDFCQLHITLLLNIANLYIFLGEFKRTKEVLAHLESMSFLFKDRQMLLMALAKTIVRIYEENVMEAYKTCQEAYEYAIKINRSTEENIYLSFILVIRGYLLMRRHLKVQAEKDFKQALSLSQEKGYKGAWLFSLIGYSYYYLKNEQYEEAEKQLEQAEILEKEVNSAYLLNMI